MAGLKTEDIFRYLEANHGDAFRDALEYARSCGLSPSSPEVGPSAVAGPSADVEPMSSDGPSDAEVAPTEHPAKAAEGTRVPRAPRAPPAPQLSGSEMEEDGSSSSSAESDDGFETVSKRSAKRKTKVPKALPPPKKANKPKGKVSRPEGATSPVPLSPAPATAAERE